MSGSSSFFNVLSSSPSLLFLHGTRRRSGSRLRSESASKALDSRYALSASPSGNRMDHTALLITNSSGAY